MHSTANVPYIGTFDGVPHGGYSLSVPRLYTDHPYPLKLLKNYYTAGRSKIHYLLRRLMVDLGFSTDFASVAVSYSYITWVTDRREER